MPACHVHVDLRADVRSFARSSRALHRGDRSPSRRGCGSRAGRLQEHPGGPLRGERGQDPRRRQARRGRHRGRDRDQREPEVPEALSRHLRVLALRSFRPAARSRTRGGLLSIEGLLRRPRARRTRAHGRRQARPRRDHRRGGNSRRRPRGPRRGPRRPGPPTSPTQRGSRPPTGSSRPALRRGVLREGGRSRSSFARRPRLCVRGGDGRCRRRPRGAPRPTSWSRSPPARSVSSARSPSKALASSPPRRSAAPSPSSRAPRTRSRSSTMCSRRSSTSASSRPSRSSPTCPQLRKRRLRRLDRSSFRSA